MMASIGIIVVLSSLATPLRAVSPEASSGDHPFQEVRLEGQVVLLAVEARARGIQVEDGADGGQVVLKLEGGRCVPLFCNAASKALFTDARLRERKTVVVGRSHEGLPFLEVILFKVEDTDGVLKIPEYFCDVCTIRVRYNQICPCCQGPMELRMKPEP